MRVKAILNNQSNKLSSRDREHSFDTNEEEIRKSWAIHVAAFD